MNTILKHLDIDVYLLNFLDLVSIIRLTIISKNQYALLLKQEFIADIYRLQRINCHPKNYIIRYACLNNSIPVLEWALRSNLKFDNIVSLRVCARIGSHNNILEWLDKNSSNIILQEDNILNTIEKR